MKTTDIIAQILIFFAALTTTAYAIFSQGEKEAIKRTALIGKLIGSVLVAFFIMPAIMEYFNLSIRATLLFTVIIVSGFDLILKAAVKKIIKTIDKDGEDTIDS